MMKQRIELREQINGGKTYYYPVNKAAERVCRLMRRKTLVPADLELLKALFFEPVLVQERRKL